MKKEAINTFGEGLIMDLHPLTTPNNVLTSCLNGTIVTYNGNEFVLLNDIGNSEVHTAKLDKGFVPVGMKEHGGIIYVAAHNPITGESQIGSFPSPQLLYEGDDLNVTNVNFSFNEFIYDNKNIPFIKLEYYKLKLFLKINTGEVKVFHPGDRFLIMTNSLDSNLIQAINDGAVRLRLGVINKSGSIDYIDEKNLRLYSNGLWIYENKEGKEPAELLKDNKIIQVFSAKSSGILIIVIELRTFKTFNLLRKYSTTGNNINVEFFGEMDGVFKGNTKKDTNTVALIEGTEFEVKPEIILTGTSGKKKYKIMPVCPYGVLERMAKFGTIDFDSIRINSENLNEWRFFISEKYLKIGWGYDYYNMDKSTDILGLDFVFININNSEKFTNKNQIDTSKGDYIYRISKEYYNGSFEEIIPFANNTIKRDWVYLVRIDRHIKDKVEVVGYRLIYTSAYFNEYYETIQDFTKGINFDGKLIILNGEERKRKNIPIKTSTLSTIQNDSFAYTLKLKDLVEHHTVESIKPSQYLSEVTTSTDISKYLYETGKIGNYNVKITPIINYEYDTKLFAGIPDKNVINNYFGSKPTIKKVEFDYNNVKTNNLEYESFISKPQSSHKLEFTGGNITGKLSTTRYIYSKTGEVTNKNIKSESLSQVYSKNMLISDRDKLFSFNSSGGILKCALGYEDYISYNGIIQINGKVTGEGIDAGAGHGDDGLQTALTSMGNGTIGIMGGHKGDLASLSYRDSIRQQIDDWYCTKNEVDKHDDFLIATWKDTLGLHHLINLMSRKTEPTNINSNLQLIRVDYMLRCFLSLLLIAKIISKNAYYVGPKPSNFTYHMAGNTLCNIFVEVPNKNTDINLDFFLGDSKTSIESHINNFKKYVEITNFLPIFKIHKGDSLVFKLEIGKNIDISRDSEILNCYTNAYSAISSILDNLDTYSRNKIYIADTSDGYTVNLDGSLELNSIKPKDLKVNTMIDWKGRIWSFNKPINEMFINTYAYENKTGPMPEDYYNEILLKNYNLSPGVWEKLGDGDAPNLAVDILEGTKSIFKSK